MYMYVSIYVCQYVSFSLKNRKNIGANLLDLLELHEGRRQHKTKIRLSRAYNTRNLVQYKSRLNCKDHFFGRSFVPAFLVDIFVFFHNDF